MDGGLTEVTIKYGSECQEGVNPYNVINGIRYKKLDGTHWAVMGFSGSSIANVTLPATIDELPVDEISKAAFYNDSTIATINLDNITKINYDAFHYCSNLTDVGDLSSVTYYGEYCFMNCESLVLTSNTFTIGANVEYICDLAFSGVNNVESIVIEDGANPNISDAAFRNMYGLKDVDIGDSATSVGDFVYCSSIETFTVDANNEYFKAVDNVLYRSVGSNKYYLMCLAGSRSQTSYVMPNDVTGMDGYCAYGASTLQSLTFNDVVTTVAGYSFQNCSNLTSVTFGSAITVINNSFGDCSSLASLEIPANVKTIYQRAFENCTSLTSVIFDEGCQYLSCEVFKNCTSLSIMVLPTTLNNVGNNESWSVSTTDVFEGCSALTNVFTRLTSGSYSGENIRSDWYGTRTLNLYSESELSGCWHFVAGVPTLW